MNTLIKWIRVLWLACEETPPLDLALSAIALPLTAHAVVYAVVHLGPIFIWISYSIALVYAFFAVVNTVRLLYYRRRRKR